MKPPVKQFSSNIRKKNSGHSSLKNKKSTFSDVKNSIEKPKNDNLTKVTYRMKRYSKQTVKNILLSKVFHTTFKIFVGVLVFSIVSYGVYSYFNNSLANDIVVSKSEIVDRVAKLTPLPEGLPDAIVRVEDPEILKKQNSFYENVKNGDYIVIYPKLAVIYDLRNNSIVAIKKTEER